MASPSRTEVSAPRARARDRFAVRELKARWARFRHSPVDPRIATAGRIAVLCLVLAEAAAVGYLVGAPEEGVGVGDLAAVEGPLLDGAVGPALQSPGLSAREAGLRAGRRAGLATGQRAGQRAGAKAAAKAKKAKARAAAAAAEAEAAAAAAEAASEDSAGTAPETVPPPEPAETAPAPVPAPTPKPPPEPCFDPQGFPC